MEAMWLGSFPVRQRSARPDSPWEEVGPWVPLDPEEPGGAEVRDAQLWLNDSKATGSEARSLRVRAITRRADAQDDGATWVTNAPSDLFTPRELLALYSGRWANQEHVFRDGNGRLGLHRHCGYGKR